MWQPEILDAKFDYQNYLEKKKDRAAAHQRKLSQWAIKQDKLDAEIQELEKQIADFDAEVNKNVTEYEKYAPILKEKEKQEKLSKKEK